MKAAVVRAPGRAPLYEEFPEPVAAPGERGISVTASAISRTTKSRAAGKHYAAPGSVPFVVGVDGVGRLENGTRVYFALPRAPYGGMAERTVVPESRCVPLPPGLDDVTAAAIANPGISSWAALTERAELRPGETVLINGATGTAGRLAVQVSKQLGAGKVIATGRNPAALAAVAQLGADETVSLVGELSELDRALERQFAGRVDVVLDYLWGKSAERLLVAAARASGEGVPVRYVEIGSASGADLSLPSEVLRASAILLMGSGTGSVPVPRLLDAASRLFDAAAAGHWQVPVRVVPLSEVAAAWSAEEGGPRIVLTVAPPTAGRAAGPDG